VSLGRLVEDPKAPGQGFFDPSDKLLSKPKPLSETSNVNNISKLIDSGTSAGLELTLAAFANTFLKGTKKDVRQLTAKAATQYLLLNSADWFEDICQRKKHGFGLKEPP
jgi:hypothetical protein